MTTESSLRVTELDFDSIKENLKTYLRSQNEFQDFDFEGAGMSVLLDILAYNTHYMGFYLNMVGNEMFLDTAQLRNSVLSHAKSINYVPTSSQGSTTKLNIKVTPSATEDQNSTVLVLDKYTRLLGSDIAGVNYPFVAVHSNTSIKVSGSFSFSNVSIRQGEVVTFQYLVDPTNTRRRFEIPSANVDVSTIVVTVQESSSNTDTHQYVAYSDITEMNGNTKTYFIEENDNLNYTIQFGDNVIGHRPKDGSVVICTYLDTVGAISNSISKFTFVEPIGGVFTDNVITTAVSSSYGGMDKETIEETRFRAPYYYTTQNRAVTSNDYEVLILKDYPTIDSVSVWGGEDNDPVVYGKVFIALKTKGNYFLTNLEKEQIKSKLIKSRNMLTVTPEIVDPDYCYITIKGQVGYDYNLTSLSAEEVNELAKAAVFDYADSELNRFQSTFRKSRLQQRMESAEKSISGSELDIFIRKQVEIDTTKPKAYEIDFGTSIKRGDFNTRISTFPELEVYDANGVSRSAFIEEVPLLQTGIESIDLTSFGAGYLTAPIVTILGDGSGAVAEAQILSGRVSNIKITNHGQNYTTAVVSISGGSGAGAAADVKLQSELGALRIVYFKDNGEKITMYNNVGWIDYKNGKMKLNSLRVYSVAENDIYNNNILAITAPCDSDTIYPLRNRVLVIDEDNGTSIQLETKAD